MAGRSTRQGPLMDAPAGKRAAPTRDPERTRRMILDAATGEFTAKGLNGARVDDIAARAQVNKRMIYHYFGDKEGLYLAVLEETYAGIRNAEIGLKFADKHPVEGMRGLIEFTWDYFIKHPEFLSLLATENLHRAHYLKQSQRIRDLHSPLVGFITDLLSRGEKLQVFRSGVDPVQLYISIASLGFFYMSNRFTLATIFGRELDAPDALKERGEHIADVILAYLKR
jgi:AcrR family transcriptional regulator